MRTFSLTTALPAPPGAAWATLVDLPRWPEWNHLVPRGAGTVAPGETLSFSIRRQDGGLRPHRPVVVALVPDRELVLAADFGHRRLLRLVHTFELVPTAGGCRLDQSWVATGLLVAPLWPSLTRTMGRFAALGEDLAARLSAPPPP